MSSVAIKGTQKPELVKGAKSEAPSRLLTPFDEMDQLFNRFFGDVYPLGFFNPWRSGATLFKDVAPLDLRSPKVDVVERDDAIVVRAEVPGIDKENLEITASDTAVTIKGETKREEKQEKGEYYRKEISSASFSRTVALPNYVDADRAEAAFKDGVLEVTLPKVTKSTRKTIKVA